MRNELIQLAGSAAKKTGAGLGAATSSFEMILQAHAQYKSTVAIEQTKRAAIDAERDVRLAELRNQKEVLEHYLKNVFAERASMIQGFFAALDRGIDNKDDNLIGQALGAIVAVARQSPLADVEKIISAVNDKNVRVIDI